MHGMKIDRVYERIIERHLAEERQMVFLSGPRQVGKTTLCEEFQTLSLNWDSEEGRDIVLRGARAVAEAAGVPVAGAESLVGARRPIVALDELHHYPQWKRFLKGLFDSYWKQMRILVTGSARLNVYKRGGDSLMGRYFPYRMHPLSVGELLHPVIPNEEINRDPEDIGDVQWDRLLAFGGFPEPYSRNSQLFSRRWRKLRFEQLVREDIRKDTAIRELDQIETLARILSERSGEQLVYASLGREVGVSEITARDWVSVLSSFFFGFRVPPWSRHIANAIRKTPKWYLRDWSGIVDAGKRNETFVACHLLKAIELWTDVGFGEYGLHYVRTKQKQEVDFLVTKDGKPWFLVEVKTGDRHLSRTLVDVQKALNAPYAFQVVMEMPFIKADAFSSDAPVVVPARTFLAQLV